MLVRCAIGLRYGLDRAATSTATLLDLHKFKAAITGLHKNAAGPIYL